MIFSVFYESFYYSERHIHLMHHFDHQYPACQRQLLRERLLISHGQVTLACHAQQSIRFTSFYRLKACQSAEAPQDFHRIALAHHHETSGKKGAQRHGPSFIQRHVHHVHRGALSRAQGRILATVKGSVGTGPKVGSIRFQRHSK